MKAKIPGILRRPPAAQAGRDRQARPRRPRLHRPDRRRREGRATTTRSSRPASGPGDLPPAAQKVFDAVVIRLIAAFYPACVKEVTTVAGVSNGVPFRARGVRVLEPGWTVLYPRKDDDRKDGRAGAARVPPRRERPARAVRPAGRDHAAEALHRGQPARGDGDGRQAGRRRGSSRRRSKERGLGTPGDAGGDHRDPARRGATSPARRRRWPRPTWAATSSPWSRTGA